MYVDHACMYACMYVDMYVDTACMQDTKSAFSNGLITLEKSKLCG